MRPPSAGAGPSTMGRSAHSSSIRGGLAGRGSGTVGRDSRHGRRSLSCLPRRRRRCAGQAVRLAIAPISRVGRVLACGKLLLPVTRDFGTGRRGRDTDGGVPLSALRVWRRGRGVCPHRPSGHHVDPHVPPCAKCTLRLLAGRLLIEGKHTELCFDLYLDGRFRLGMRSRYREIVLTAGRVAVVSPKKPGHRQSRAGRRLSRLAWGGRRAASTRSGTALPSIPLFLPAAVLCSVCVDVVRTALSERKLPLVDWHFSNVGRIRPTNVPVPVVGSTAHEDGDAVQGLEVNNGRRKALLGARTAHKVSSGET